MLSKEFVQIRLPMLLNDLPLYPQVHQTGYIEYTPNVSFG